MKKEYAMSIRCYFPGTANNRTQHYPVMPLRDIAKWVEAYQFTHPTAESITDTLKVHFQKLTYRLHGEKGKTR